MQCGGVEKNRKKNENHFANATKAKKAVFFSLAIFFKMIHKTHYLAYFSFFSFHPRKTSVALHCILTDVCIYSYRANDRLMHLRLSTFDMCQH